MNKFNQLYKQILTEAPIVDFEVLGDISNDRYDKKTVKFIENPQYKKQLEKSWSKTKHDFSIKFINGDESTKEYGIASPEFIKQKFGIENYQPTPNVITVFFTNNEGAELRPITPWIAAHRFGHALRAGIARDRVTKTHINTLENFFVDILNAYLSGYGLYKYRFNKINQFITFSKIPKDLARTLVQNIGTMNSARNKNIPRPFEFFYELIAQFIINGHIVFNMKPDPIEYDGKTHTFNPDMVDNEINTKTLYFNKMLSSFLSQSEGKVFVM